MSRETPTHQPGAPADGPRAADVSRRRMLGLAMAAAAGAAARPVEWVFALTPGGAIVKRQQEPGETHQRHFFTAEELEAVARVCDVILPRTETPGARDARVHEYVDLDVSVSDEDEQTSFRQGLKRLDQACRSAHSVALHQATPAHITALLTPLDQEVAAAADPDRVGDDAGFYRWIKGKTIFGYYTSREGRVEELGLPEAITMERWRGCPHGDGGHDGSA